jgi:prepilin signal peptidase PulO-like enzyme (type II secretory pathway)
VSRKQFVLYFVNFCEVSFAELLDYFKIIDIQGKAVFIKILLNARWIVLEAFLLVLFPIYTLAFLGAVRDQVTLRTCLELCFLAANFAARV